MPERDGVVDGWVSLNAVCVAVRLSRLNRQVSSRTKPTFAWVLNMLREHEYVGVGDSMVLG